MKTKSKPRKMNSKDAHSNLLDGVKIWVENFNIHDEYL